MNNDLKKHTIIILEQVDWILDDYNKEIKQGLHITSMGGSWMSIIEGFAGVKNN